MSLEDQVARLANAVAMNSEGSAVAEIIRQRDAAQRELGIRTSQRDYWMQQESNSSGRRYKLERKLSALRGVITRMKKAAHHD